MYQAFRTFYKERLTAFWRVIKPIIQRTIGFLFIGVIIAGAWYGFLSMVKTTTNRHNTSSNHGMDISFCFAFLTIPNILDKVKKIKVNDFELELQETVTKATSRDFMSVPDFDEHIFSTKGNFRNLGIIMEQVARFPSKPVLLVVNLRDDHHISILCFLYI